MERIIIIYMNIFFAVFFIIISLIFFVQPTCSVCVCVNQLHLIYFMYNQKAIASEIYG